MVLLDMRITDRGVGSVWHENICNPKSVQKVHFNNVMFLLSIPKQDQESLSAPAQLFRASFLVSGGSVINGAYPV